MKIIGAAVLVLAFAISAQAQSGRGASPHFTAAPSSHAVSGAGAGGGASAGGSRVLPHFALRSVAGSSSDYIPSTFVTWAKAVAEGKAALAARPAPLCASAHPDAKTVPMKPTSAKTRIVQSQNGAPAIETH